MYDKKVEAPTHSDREQTCLVYDQKSSLLESRQIFSNICEKLVTNSKSTYEIFKVVIDFEQAKKS